MSIDLSAWTGLVGVVVGVLMTTGIDAWRTQQVDRKRTRRELVRAGSELADATAAFERAQRAAGDQAQRDPTWMEITDARGSAMMAALLTIGSAGVRELDDAALSIVRLGLKPMPSGPEGRSRYLDEQQSLLNAFRDVVLKVRL